MQKLNSMVLGAAITAAVTMGASGAAHAGASAYATLDINNFTLGSTLLGRQFDVADFDTVNVNNTSTNSGSASGFIAPPPNTQVDNTLGGGNADDNRICVGACGGTVGTDDSFVQHAVGANAHFTSADNVLLGALITGLGPQSFVNAIDYAEGATSETASGQGSSQVGTGTNFSFNLTNDDQLIFDFDGTPFIDVLLHQDDVATQGSISYSININIAGTNTTVFSWSPSGSAGGITGGTEISDEVNINTQRDQLDAGNTQYNPGTGHFRAISDTLLADTTYTLSIAHGADADYNAIKAPPVPAPTSLALLGAGLFGVSAFARRRRAKKA